MTQRLFTVDDLKRILLEGAGEVEGADLETDILDLEFDVIGYDSIALLETGSRVEREFEVELDDEELATAGTPREFIEVVNRQLAKSAEQVA
ncbi:actinorhodin polyketide synthase [Saccharomonospora sp. CUA-673]|uniref:acyl carrier protein n=1 Tax=Saccharomonospora sp. CUA-673 TaxID=1904969 RepID=UPI000962C332|nr:acyl carrier protein [Saccharomonospora sp. CUA-673]OLT48989.1 actinorhodin polyketide synthase [Saccharomonospora sp. CUA-673]